MAKKLGEKTLNILYEAQRQILAKGRDTEALLAALSQTAAEISQTAEFALLFYDTGTREARIRFNAGLDKGKLKTFCEKFTSARSSNAKISTEIIPDSNDKSTYLIPIGEPETPFGILIMSASSNAEIEGLEEFRQIAGDAISQFMEVELVKLQLAELETLLKVGKAISSTLDLTELLTKIMGLATQVMRCETSTVYLVDKRTNELYFHIIQGDAKVGAKLQEIRLPMGTGLAGWCAKESKPVIVPDTEKDPRFFRGADKKSGFVTRSMICVPMRLKDEVIGVLQVLNRTGDISFNDHDVEILGAVANQAVSALDNARLYANIQKVYLATVEVLATAIDAKDPYTHGHSRRVTQYSVAMAEEMGFDKKTVEDIRYAGLLHDVGKIGIKDSIIGKPERLTDEEYTIIKRHPIIGAEILRPVDFLADKIPGVLHHHEYFDGRGYPDHLTGENIPLIGRIICVSDAFDAMTSNRPYRKGLSVSVAVGELKKFSGKQFDPICVEAFLKACDKKSFEWFDKSADSEELVLKPESEKLTPMKGHVPKVNQQESQPFPPTHTDQNKGKESSQPFPPIHPDEKPNGEKPALKNEEAMKHESQPYPPISGDKKEESPKPSTQPFPPVGMEEPKKK